jgi:hypothetical protein
VAAEGDRPFITGKNQIRHKAVALVGILTLLLSTNCLVLFTQQFFRRGDYCVGCYSEFLVAGLEWG